MRETQNKSSKLALLIINEPIRFSLYCGLLWALLAHRDITSPHRVGKYKVDVKGLESFLEAIPLLKPPGSLIVIDEIGKMECFSELFRHVVRQVRHAVQSAYGR